MDTDQDKYQSLQKNRAGKIGAAAGFGNSSNPNSSGGNSQQKYEELQRRRIEDAKRNANTQLSGGGNEKGGSVLSERTPTRAGRKISLKNVSAKDAIAVASAFTAIDFGKDGIHFAVIMFSIIADGITLIPVIGSFAAIPFSILIWILYAVGGHLRNRVGRKAVITGASQACELLGFEGLSILPFYTLSAGINYWLALIERKRSSQQ